MLLLPSISLAAAINPNVRGPIYQIEPGARTLSIGAVFGYGAGGTSVDAYVQSSFDGAPNGNWFDVANFHFTTAAAFKAFDMSAPVGTILTLASAAIAANTSLGGIVGDYLSVLYGSVGTYTGASSLAIYAAGVRLRGS